MLPAPNYIESINRLVTLIMVSISNAYGTHIFNLVVHRIMDRFNKRKKYCHLIQAIWVFSGSSGII